MYKFLTKNGQTIAFGAGVLISLIFLISVFGGLDEFNAYGDKDPARYATTIFDFGLYAAAFLSVICFLIAVVFAIIHIAGNPKGSIKGIIGVGVLLVVAFILYSTSVHETSGPVATQLTKFNVTEGASKFISGAIKLAGLMMAFTGIAFVVSEVRNFFK